LTTASKTRVKPHTRSPGRAFQKGYDGLQILWDSQELEFIPARLLQLRDVQAVESWTSVHYRGRNSAYPRSYHYPTSVAASANEIRLTYTTAPPAWSLAYHDDLIPGTTVIALRDGRPVKVTWHPDHDRTYPLAEVRDWAYLPPEQAPVEQVVRGKLPAMVTQREGQQVLKAMLLADRGGCQLTTTRAPQVLEICHIVEVKDNGNDDRANVLLLRRDLHTLFDRRLLQFKRVAQGWCTRVDPAVTDEIYRNLDGRILAGFDLHQPYLARRAELEERAAARAV
jgi:hypothetical protein